MELKFNSQVCTDRNQSKKLLALGLKPETADMYHSTYISENRVYEVIATRYDKLPLLSQDTPAWSLHRLILLCPNTGVLTITEGSVEYEGLINYQVKEEDGFFSKQGNDIYGNLLDCIEWLIKKGYFPKEHLF